MDMLERIEAGKLTQFDYAQMPQDVAREARGIADQYRTRLKAYVIDTGRDLIAIKDRLEHGLFQRWVEAEMGMTPRTAQNLMQAAANLGDKSEIVSHLPATLLYKLAAPSTPAPVREQVLRRLEAGETLTGKQIEREVDEGREEARQRDAADREKARRERLTPEAREEEDAIKAKRDKGRQARERKAAREEADRQERRDAQRAEVHGAATFLVDAIGPDLLAAFFERFGNLAHDAMWAAKKLAQCRRAEAAPEVEMPAEKIFRTGTVYSFGLGVSPEHEARVRSLAAAIEAGEEHAPILISQREDGGSSRPYEILSGDDEFIATADILGRSIVPVRIAPRVEHGELAVFNPTER